MKATGKIELRTGNRTLRPPDRPIPTGGETLKSIEASSRMTRRESLKRAATFMILPAGLASGYAANEKLNIGVIGLHQGML